MAENKQKKIKAVAFDFDGTIADSFPVFMRGVEATLSRTFTEAEIKDLSRYSAREVLKILKIRLWQIPYLGAKLTREVDRHHADITIFPGMADTLKTLRLQGYKLYIVSSHSKSGMTTFFKQNGLEDAFDYMYSKVGLFGKPKALKKLQKQFKYAASECAYVGDEIRDVEAAKKAGVPCVSVSWGFNAVDAIAAHNPSAIINKPSELIDALLSL